MKILNGMTYFLVLVFLSLCCGKVSAYSCSFVNTASTYTEGGVTRGYSGSYLVETCNPSGMFEFDDDGEEDDDKVEEKRTPEKDSSGVADICSPTKGNPITIIDGNKVETVNDFIGKGQFPLLITRTYSSNWDGESIFGKGWIGGYDYSLSISTSKIYAKRPDGSVITFTRDSSGLWKDYKVNSLKKMEKIGGNWFFTTEGGIIEKYTSDGEILKRTKNGISHSYSLVNGNTVITHSSGRTLTISFKGIRSGNPTVITDSLGNKYIYSFYRSGNLETVTKPGDLSPSIKYLYNPYLTNVIVGGKVYATFRYSNNKAISTEHAGGVDKYSFYFNPYNNETEVTNPLGHKTVYKHNRINLSHLSSDPDAHIVVYKITSMERVAKFDCPQASKSYTYTKDGYKDTSVDWNGVITDYNYDSKGRLNSKVEAKGTSSEVTKVYKWISGKNLISQELSSELKVDYQYNEDQTLRSITQTSLNPYDDGEVRRTTITYQKHANNIVSKKIVDGPREDVNDLTTFNYDNQGNLLNISNALGQTIRYGNYDRLGNLGRKIDSNNLITDYTYDKRSRLKTIKTYKGINSLLTSIYYSSINGKIKTIKYPSGIIHNYKYDDAHRLTYIEDADGNNVEYVYNKNSNVIGKYINSKEIEVWEETDDCDKEDRDDECDDVLEDVIQDTYYSYSASYDSLGRLKTENGLSKNILNYDNNSNVTSITDGAGKVSKLKYDQKNRLVNVGNRDGGNVYFAYNNNGRLLSVKDQRGLITDYKYNGFGEVVEVDSPDTGISIFSYNKAGQVVFKKISDNSTINYDYDEIGRLTKESSNSNSVIYKYDTASNGVGRLQSINDGVSKLSFNYDGFGNVVSERLDISSKIITTNYYYNNKNELYLIKYPSGNKVKYEYNTVGKILRVLSSVNGLTFKPVIYNAEYIPFGPLKSFAYGNNAVRKMTYDTKFRIMRVFTSGIQDLSYSYDFKSNINLIKNNRLLSLSQTYQYDSENRLLSEVSITGGNKKFTYDRAGNRKTFTLNSSSTKSYSYSNMSNQLNSVTNIGSITYNDIGSIATKKGGSYSYDDWGRLTKYTRNGVVTTYKYNRLGQRIVKQHGSILTYYIYNRGGQLIAEHNSQGSVVKEYVYFGNQVVAVIKGNAQYYVHNDHLGRAERITNQNKSTVWYAHNFSFDRVVKVNHIGGYNLGFPGQYWDSEKGSYYNYFRDYEPELGRYIQSDPIGLAGGINTYAYVGGNPISQIDPLGLDIAVINGGPTDGNPIGHTAIAISGHGVFSYGTGTKLGSSLESYLLEQATYRNTIVTTINTTKAQDAAALKAIMSFEGKPLQKYPDNCAARSSSALTAAGLPHSNVSGNPWNVHVMGDAARVMLGGSTVVIPIGTTQIPSSLEGY